MTVTFQVLLASFIGSTVEIFVPGSMFEGTLTAVQTGAVEVQESPVIYSKPVLVTIPTPSIEYVRVLV